MRYGCSSLLLPILLTASMAQKPNPSDSPPFKVTISSVQPSTKLGQPVWIHIILKNTSSEVLPVPELLTGGFQGELNYNIEVLNLVGKPVPDRRRGQEIKNGMRAPHGEYILKHVGPGDEIVETADLNTVAEIPAPGDYLVRVERADPRYLKLHIKSNSIVIHITP